jgi:hypothetical protein
LKDFEISFAARENRPCPKPDIKQRSNEKTAGRLICPPQEAEK